MNRELILDEVSYAKKCLEEGIPNDKTYLAILNIAKYYYHKCGYRTKKMRRLLSEYLSKHYPYYETEFYQCQDAIDLVIRKAKKYAPIELSGIKVTCSEMETIKGLHDKVLERLAFTMLCLAKYYNAKNPNNNGWLRMSSKEIFDHASIKCKAIDREVKIAQLQRKGLLEFSKKITNTDCRVTFINDDDAEELFVFDLRKLGYEYLLYNGQNFTRCGECGILFRNRTKNPYRYCENCRQDDTEEFKTITCIDCGKRFLVSRSNKRTTRCEDCYAEYRRNYYRESKRLQREKM